MDKIIFDNDNILKTTKSDYIHYHSMLTPNFEEACSYTHQELYHQETRWHIRWSRCLIVNEWKPAKANRLDNSIQEIRTFGLKHDLGLRAMETIQCPKLPIYGTISVGTSILLSAKTHKIPVTSPSHMMCDGVLVRCMCVCVQNDRGTTCSVAMETRQWRIIKGLTLIVHHPRHLPQHRETEALYVLRPIAIWIIVVKYNIMTSSMCRASSQPLRSYYEHQ